MAFITSRAARRSAHAHTVTRTMAGATRAVALVALLGLAGCSMAPTPIHVIDPDSPCARLRVSYPSEHGLVLFTDTSATSVSIPWCFPGTAGFGVLGYNVNVPVAREGTLTLALSDIKPQTTFGAVSTDASCSGNATGKLIRRLGYGTAWSMHVTPGDYCITLIPAQQTVEDIWFGLMVERP